MNIIHDSKNGVIDHRYFSKFLDLYFFDSNNQGLPFLLPNWVIMRNIIQSVIRTEWLKFDFNEIMTPIISNEILYKVSGHLDHYEDYMFPKMEIKNGKNTESYYLRPMTCPHHCMVYKKNIISYKKLPFRICENSFLHRYESSGSLKGLERARFMELVDHHIFVDFLNLKNELKRAYFFSENILRKFNFSIDRVILSLRGENSSKYHDFHNIWNDSENILSEILSEISVDYAVKKDAAAFYGPKIDLEVKSLDGKYLTISTIQLDFYLPMKFDLCYIDREGGKKTPVIIHHSPIGTYQRFIALLCEKNYNKPLPLIISPIQLAFLPTNDDHEIISYCNYLRFFLIDKNMRVKVFYEEKRLSYRINSVYEKKIPFYSVVGIKELKEKKIIIKDCSNGNISNHLNLDEVYDFLIKKISLF